MREAISLDKTTGTSRWQEEHDVNDDLALEATYAEMLQVERHCYERMDVKKSPVVKSEEPMAQISWSTAEVMRNASNLAFAMEAYRRGMTLVSVQKILSGTHHDSGKRKHRRKQNKSNAALVAV